MSIAVQTPPLRFVPIPLDMAERARRTRKDEFGHDLVIRFDRAPCRVCLRISEAAEDLLLLSYRPLPDRNPYAEVGPIFIHVRDCAPYESLDTFPHDFRARELVLRAYDAEGSIFDAKVAPPGEGERVAGEFLADRGVAEVHVRHRSYTCFAFKIVRG